MANPFPIFILGGGAGSGKDTVAGMMCEAGRGITIAQADPMKRFAKDTMGFTEDQLWGPSASRNAPDPRFADLDEKKLWGGDAFWDVVQKTFDYDDEGNDESIASRWLEDIGAANTPNEEGRGLTGINTWLSIVLKTAIKNGQLTPRMVLQLLGTEFGRQLDPDIWSRYAIRTARQLLAGGYDYDRTLGLVKNGNNPGYDFVVITDGRFRNEILNIRALGGYAIRIDNPEDQKDQQIVEAAGVKGHASEAELKGIPAGWYNAILKNDKALGLEHLRRRVYELLGDL